MSGDLAGAFGSYINDLGLKDSKGNLLVLEKSPDGIYTSGSYSNFILSTIENSLNNFLSDTTFPYTKTAGGFKADGGFGGGAPIGNMPGQGISGVNTDQSADTTTTYETVQDYIDSLNSDEEWVKYDVNTNTVTITSIEAFVKYCKNASKAVPAFDNVNRHPG